jgi:hypothetical protein
MWHDESLSYKDSFKSRRAKMPPCLILMISISFLKGLVIDTDEMNDERWIVHVYPA